MSCERNHNFVVGVDLARDVKGIEGRDGKSARQHDERAEQHGRSAILERAARKRAFEF